MNVTLRRAFLLTLAIGMTGCSGGKKSDIGGTITRGGKPLVWESEGGHLLVIFFPEDRTANPDVYSATTDRAAGTYSIPKLRAGKYIVAIQQFDERHLDALGGKYDPVKTQLHYEVIQDGQVIDIDLPKDLPSAKGP